MSGSTKPLRKMSQYMWQKHKLTKMKTLPGGCPPLLLHNTYYRYVALQNHYVISDRIQNKNINNSYGNITRGPPPPPNFTYHICAIVWESRTTTLIRHKMRNEHWTMLTRTTNFKLYFLRYVTPLAYQDYQPYQSTWLPNILAVHWSFWVERLELQEPVVSGSFIAY